MKHAWIAALALCALGGCANDLLATHGSPPQVYRIESGATPPGGQALPGALSVARPRAVASLDTDRIAVARGGGTFDYYAGVRWADPAPLMLQQVLVETLAADGRYATTVAAPSRVPTEYLLDVELRQYTAFYSAGDAPPQVRVAWQATLVESRTGRRLASFLAQAEVGAAANRRDAVIAAFQQATQAAVQQSVQQIRHAGADAAD